MRLKVWLKHRCFPDKRIRRRVRGGIGKGLLMLLNRRHELAKEFGLWEREAQAVYRGWVKPETVAWDVGAGDGDSALLLARLTSPARMVVFEPDADARKRLVENFAMNPCLPFPMIFSTAVGTDPGDTIKLDHVVLSGMSVPGFVKIDVDGMETAVLGGAGHLLTQHRPAVLVETHSLALERDCIARFRTAGYATQIIHPAWWRRLWPEHRPGHNRWVLAIPQ